MRTFEVQNQYMNHSSEHIYGAPSFLVLIEEIFKVEPMYHEWYFETSNKFKGSGEILGISYKKYALNFKENILPDYCVSPTYFVSSRYFLQGLFSSDTMYVIKKTSKGIYVLYFISGYVIYYFR